MYQFLPSPLTTSETRPHSLSAFQQSKEYLIVTDMLLLPPAHSNLKEPLTHVNKFSPHRGFRRYSCAPALSRYSGLQFGLFVAESLQQTLDKRSCHVMLDFLLQLILQCSNCGSSYAPTLCLNSILHCYPPKSLSMFRSNCFCTKSVHLCLNRPPAAASPSFRVLSDILILLMEPPTLRVLSHAPF